MNHVIFYLQDVCWLSAAKTPLALYECHGDETKWDKLNVDREKI